MDRTYTCLSIFSGAMGLDLGLNATGRYRLLACVELVPAFCATIRENQAAGKLSRKVRVIESDVREARAGPLMDTAGVPAADLDVLTGGPPCQAFSVFGKRRGLDDARGQLIFEYLRLVADIRPKVFLMENVRGLLSLRAAPSRPKGSLFELVQQRFADAGYRTDCFLVNSANYGGPQIRERMILIGNRYNLEADFPTPTHSNRTADGLAPFVTLGDAIRGLPDADPTVMDFSDRKKRYLAMVPPGGNWRSLSVEIQKESMGKTWYLKGGRSAYWRKLSYEFPCPTIVTMPNHAGTSLCHPDELRPLSVGECARVQGFPADWRFTGTPAERYQQVGNAVPTILGQVAGQAVADLLDRIGNSPSREQQPMKPHRVIHLRPHVRTRWWWKAGQVVNGLSYSLRPAKRPGGGANRSLFDTIDQPDATQPEEADDGP